MTERRVQFGLGIAYDTPHDKLRAVPDMLREIVMAQSSACVSIAPTSRGLAIRRCCSRSCTSFSTATTTVYMDVQQAINLAIARRFQSEGIDFAYPTRTLFLRQDSTLSSRAAKERSDELRSDESYGDEGSDKLCRA